MLCIEAIELRVDLLHVRVDAERRAEDKGLVHSHSGNDRLSEDFRWTLQGVQDLLA